MTEDRKPAAGDSGQMTKNRHWMLEGERRRSAEGFRILHHFSKFPADDGTNIVQLCFRILTKITIGCCAAKPVYCFLQFPICIRQFRQKVCRLAALRPTLRKVSPNSTRRASNLVNQSKL